MLRLLLKVAQEKRDGSGGVSLSSSSREQVVADIYLPRLEPLVAEVVVNPSDKLALDPDARNRIRDISTRTDPTEELVIPSFDQQHRVTNIRGPQRHHTICRLH